MAYLLRRIFQQYAAVIYRRCLPSTKDIGEEGGKKWGQRRQMWEAAKNVVWSSFKTHSTLMLRKQLSDAVRPKAPRLDWKHASLPVQHQPFAFRIGPKSDVASNDDVRPNTAAPRR
jgi:hypothetical protein